LKLRALTVAAAVAIPIAGCGGSSNDPGAVSLVKNAFSKPIGSAVISIDFEANVQGSQTLKGPVSLKLSGPYQSNGRTKLPSFDWPIAISGAGTNFDGRLTSTGDDLFVGFQGQSYDAGKALIARYNQNLSQQAAQNPKRKSLKDFGIDPAGWVKGANAEGDATVAGTPTKHVSASINFDKVLSDLNSVIGKAGNVTGAVRPAQLSANERKQFTSAIKSSSLDVYIGKADSKIRRVALNLEFGLKKAASNGVKGGTITFSIQFENVGQPQVVKAPANAKPLAQLLSQLGGSTLGGGTSGSGGGTSGGSSASPKNLGAYSKCLDQAPSGDLNALQRCNALLK
jgi:hypothetical protein